LLFLLLFQAPLLHGLLERFDACTLEVGIILSRWRIARRARRWWVRQRRPRHAAALWLDDTNAVVRGCLWRFRRLRTWR
jgi:hypothetical protein